MKNFARLAMAAIPALVLAACNGNAVNSTGMTPSTNAAATHGHVHHLDNGPQDLHAGGATFPAYGYNLGSQPVGYYYNDQPGPGAGSIFASAGTTGTVYYCLTGSGAGRKAYEGDPNVTGYIPPTGACAAIGQPGTGFGGRQDPLDFVGSDVAMPSSEYPTYKQYREPGTGTSWGEPFELPTFGGPIVFSYNSSSFSVSQIKLSTWTYCAIVNGTISDWNDPAIVKDNGGSITGGSSETLDFYFRSDSSGTTYLFTNKLGNSHSGCNQTWKAPFNAAPYESGSRTAAWGFSFPVMTWNGPGSSGDPNTRFTGESGNPGVIGGIKSNTWGVGYVEGAWAASASLGQAALQNGYKDKKPNYISPLGKNAVADSLKNVTKGSIQYGYGSDGSPLGSSTPWCQLYIPPSNFVSPVSYGYPIVGLSYWLFYGNNNGVHLADKTKLIKYITSNAANNVLSPLEYTPLQASVHKAVVAALKGNGASHPACLQ